MATDSGLIEYLRELLEPLDGITVKRMFGSFGIFRHGLMFALVSDDTLYFKVDEQNKAEFTARDLGPFTYMKDGKPMPMAYYRAPEETLDNSEDMCAWAEKRVSGGGAGAKTEESAKVEKTSMTLSWTNWSNSVTCTPHTISLPHSEAEVVDLVKQARRINARIRVAGTGHSFTPLCASNELLLSLDGLQGILPHPPSPSPETEKRVSGEGGFVTVWAGTKLHQLGDPLWAMGLALENMGDIDRQALAGAISTGTHGTGRTLGSLATQVVGLRLVLASGEVVECSPTLEPALFKAAQVSLGALGVITQVTLRLLPAYQLHERTWVAAFDECLAELGDLIHANRHFEFFWAPSEDACAMKALNPVLSGSPPPSLQLVKRGPNGAASKNGVQLTGRLPRYIGDDRIDRSYRIFPSERTIKFNETEFAVPAANGIACLCEIRQLMQTKYPDIIWPIEYRTLAADDLWLSPAYGRETVTISVHQAAESPYQTFFADVEAIFRNHHGRPHWGKIHTHTAHELRALYPQWEQFQTVRQSLDPSGMWLNDYLRSIFEEKE